MSALEFRGGVEWMRRDEMRCDAMRSEKQSEGIGAVQCGALRRGAEGSGGPRNGWPLGIGFGKRGEQQRGECGEAEGRKRAENRGESAENRGERREAKGSSLAFAGIRIDHFHHLS